MTTNVQIRNADRRDADAMAEIARAAYALYVDRMGRDPAPMHADFASHIDRDIVFVAEDDVVAGYSILIDTPDGWLLDNIAVDPSRQRSGIGGQLMAHCETYLCDHNIDKYSLYTNVMMHENLSLYLALGFVETDRRIEAGFHRIYMEKTIIDTS